MARTLASSHSRCRSRLSDDDVRERSIKHMHRSNYPFIAPFDAAPSAIGFWGFDFRLFVLSSRGAHKTTRPTLKTLLFVLEWNGTTRRKAEKRFWMLHERSTNAWKRSKRSIMMLAVLFVEEHHKCQYSAASHAHMRRRWEKSLRTAERRSPESRRHAKLKVMENNFDYGTECGEEEAVRWARVDYPLTGANATSSWCWRQIVDSRRDLQPFRQIKREVLIETASVVRIFSSANQLTLKPSDRPISQSENLIKFFFSSING